MGKKKALIAGVNEYEDTRFIPLKYAINDAQDIYKVLTNKDIGEFDRDDVILIENPTRSEMETSLGKMLEEAKDKDFVFIYFAGHGKLDTLGKLCLATRDARADKFVTNSIHLDYLQSVFNQCDCKSITLIIDSCYSGSAGESFRGNILTESFEQISGHGKVIISASQTLEKSRESDAVGHGIFTHYILKGLSEGEADGDNDGVISVNELYKYACEGVKTATNGRQIPMGWGIDEGAEIVLAKNIKILQRKHDEIKNKADEARALLKKEKLKDAINLWRNVIALDSANLEAHQMLDKEIPELMEKKLIEFYTVPAHMEIFPNEICNEALKIIGMPISNLEIEGEKTYHDLIIKLLEKEKPLALESFIKIWKSIGDRLLTEKSRAGSFQVRTNSEPNRAPGSTHAGPAGQEALLVEDSTNIRGQPKSRQELWSAKDEGAGQEPAKLVRNQIFISYSRNDERWKKKLCTMLKPLVSEDLIKVWTDAEIRTGADWKAEIKKAIDAAKVGILLVSADFLASDFIMKKELPPLLEAAEEEGLTIFTIFVSDCQYDVTGIEKYQAANNPSKPLASYRGKSAQDHELTKICKKLMQAVGHK